MQFKALQTFFSTELQSEYVTGLYYTAREPNDPVKMPQDPKRAEKCRANRATLKRLLPTWIKEGKVELGGPGAQASGEGG